MITTMVAQRRPHFNASADARHDQLVYSRQDDPLVSRSHITARARYVGVLRTARHSGSALSPTVHAHICTHYPASPIIPATTRQLRPERRRWTDRS